MQIVQPFCSSHQLISIFGFPPTLGACPRRRYPLSVAQRQRQCAPLPAQALRLQVERKERELEVFRATLAKAQEQERAAGNNDPAPDLGFYRQSAGTYLDGTEGSRPDGVDATPASFVTLALRNFAKARLGSAGPTAADRKPASAGGPKSGAPAPRRSSTPWSPTCRAAPRRTLPRRSCGRSCSS